MLQPEIYLIGFITGGLTLFLNYCLGSPASEKFSPYEIFSFYTVWLSINRLKQVGLIDTYHKQFQENINRTENEHEVISLRKDYHKILYEAADPFFTWERAVGMCPVCTGFWVALLSYVISLFVQLSHSPVLDWTFVLVNLLHLVIIIVVSHITIRILNKII